MERTTATRWVIVLGVICLVSFVQAKAGGLGQCMSTLSEENCRNQGCQVVKGSRCSSTATAPPCDLDFNGETSAACCDPNNKSHERIHYLGCIAPGSECDTQCMEYTQTGDLYVVWEGCAFDSASWDIAGNSECGTCVEAICPLSAMDNWQVWVIAFAAVCIAGAMFLLISLLACGAVYFFRRYQLVKTSSQTMYSPVVQSPQLVQAKNINSESSAPKTNNNKLLVYRRNDGKIVISLGDGNVRVVTPEQYQILYERQNRRKRAIWAKLQALKQQSNSAQASTVEEPAVFKEFTSGTLD